jgi:DNA-binding XRE family transcriptional regulator
MSGGRPTKFYDIDKEYWAFMCEKGLTNREMAIRLGIHESTIYNWKKEHAEFFDTLKHWRDYADSQVEASLYQRAKGYKVKEVKLFQDKRGNIIEHETIKAYPPDPTSMIFWLKNRQPANWKDKNEVEQTNHNIEIKIDDDESGL